MEPSLGRALLSDAPLAELLPAYVRVESSVDDVDEPLFAAEEATVRSAVAERRAEHATGRALARRALAHHGVPAHAIPTGRRGEPLWPAGFVGSIAHCAGYRAAAVARADDVRGLGVDVEPRTVLAPSEILVVTTPGERRRALAADLPPEWSLHVFCAKEAAFKAVPVGHDQPLDPADIDVELHLRTGSFTATIGELRFSGCWGTTRTHVFAAALALWADVDRRTE